MNTAFKGGDPLLSLTSSLDSSFPQCFTREENISHMHLRHKHRECVSERDNKVFGSTIRRDSRRWGMNFQRHKEATSLRCSLGLFHLCSARVSYPRWGSPRRLSEISPSLDRGTGHDGPRAGAPGPAGGFPTPPPVPTPGGAGVHYLCKAFIALRTSRVEKQISDNQATLM